MEIKFLNNYLIKTRILFMLLLTLLIIQAQLIERITSAKVNNEFKSSLSSSLTSNSNNNSKQQVRQNVKQQQQQQQRLFNQATFENSNRLNNKKSFVNSLNGFDKSNDETVSTTTTYTPAINCKYLLIDQSIFNKINSQTQTNYLYKLFTFETSARISSSSSNSGSGSSTLTNTGSSSSSSGISSSTNRVELNENYFKIYSFENCLNTSVLETIKKRLDDSSSFNGVNSGYLIYGLDLSSNYLDNKDLNLIIEKNLNFFKSKFSSIRYLNLTGNSLKTINLTESVESSLSSSSSPSSSLLSESIDLILDPIFNKLSNLEVLILDRNYQFDYLSLNSNKLKIISLNKCNLNEKLVSSLARSDGFRLTKFNLPNLIYLGLNDNKLVDAAASSNEIYVYNLFDNVLAPQIDILDLSFNKLTRFETIKYLMKLSSIRKINLEKNLFSLFNVNDLFETKLDVNLSGNDDGQDVDADDTIRVEKIMPTNIEINLRFNFIRNTSLEFYQLNETNFKYVNKISIKLFGNPLVCDCNSLWLLDESAKYLAQQQQQQLKKQLQTTSKASSIQNENSNFLKRKKLKSISSPLSLANKMEQSSQNSIKLIFKKREIEEISSHHNLDDPNFDIYMQRQKRVKYLNKKDRKQQQQQSADSNSNFFIRKSPLTSATSKSIVKIIDFNHLTCSFIDVQNFPNKTSSHIPKSSAQSELNVRNQNFDSNENYDYSEYYDDKFQVDSSFGFDQELKKQNMLVNSVKYREKLIANSIYEDYMCLYEDHCRINDCDCCVFRHCHCRSICPRQCRCYFDSKLMQNIIDCSSLNLIDIPNSPIESATDMRLNSNSLKLLKSHSFFGFGQLKFLYLQNNQISYITSDAFEDLKHSIKLLNLAGNRLQYLSGEEFYDLNELSILVLNKNPLKDIDNINFINSNHLPNLKLLYLSETSLPNKKLNELISYSKNFSNSSIKYKLRDLSAHDYSIKPQSVTTNGHYNFILTITPTTTTAAGAAATNQQQYIEFDFLNPNVQINSNTENHSKNLNANKMEPVVLFNKTKLEIYETTYLDESLYGNKSSKTTKFFLQFKLVNWYYFPMLIFIICLVLSLAIILTVVMVARKYETDQQNANRLKQQQNGLNGTNESNEKTSTSCFCCCLTSGLNNDKIGLSSNYSSNLNTIHSNEEEESEDDEESTKFVLNNCNCLSGCCCPKIKKCKRSSSFDSYDCYNSTGKYLDNDLSSVPVSRSIENLTLNVFIYYNNADHDYVTCYLMPCLKKCLTIIPDTKYIAKPQVNRFVTLSPDSFMNIATNSTTLSNNLHPSNNIHSGSNITLRTENVMQSSGNKSNPNNNLIANILVISENFYGYKPMAGSLVSLKIKNGGLSGNSSSSGCSSSSSNVSNSIYNMKTKCYRLNADNAFKNAFKIYINLNDVSGAGGGGGGAGSANGGGVNPNNKPGNLNENGNLLNLSSKTHSLNQRLMKRLYESSTKFSSSSTDKTNSQILNDLNSSYAYNEKLQFKLEKYFENICLKSNSFSNTNFSYVDYTKR